MALPRDGYGGRRGGRAFVHEVFPRDRGNCAATKSKRRPIAPFFSSATSVMANRHDDLPHRARRFTKR
jgi:hypothetical protein